MPQITNKQILEAINRNHVCLYPEAVSEIPGLVSSVDKIHKKLFEDNGESLISVVRQNTGDIKILQSQDRPINERGKPEERRNSVGSKWVMRITIIATIVTLLGGFSFVKVGFDTLHDLLDKVQKLEQDK